MFTLFAAMFIACRTQAPDGIYVVSVDTSDEDTAYDDYDNLSDFEVEQAPDDVPELNYIPDYIADNDIEPEWQGPMHGVEIWPKEVRPGTTQQMSFTGIPMEYQDAEIWFEDLQGLLVQECSTTFSYGDDAISRRFYFDEDLPEGDLTAYYFLPDGQWGELGQVMVSEDAENTPSLRSNDTCNEEDIDYCDTFDPVVDISVDNLPDSILFNANVDEIASDSHVRFLMEFSELGGHRPIRVDFIDENQPNLQEAIMDVYISHITSVDGPLESFIVSMRSPSVDTETTASLFITFDNGKTRWYNETITINPELSQIEYPSCWNE
jgi:hypothetical protein